MAKLDPELERVLRAAAANTDAPEMPFGFDTRIVALVRAARGEGNGEQWKLGRWFQRVAWAAVMVTAFASSAAYWQFSQDDDQGEPYSDAYAIADTAIEANVFP